MKFDSNLKAKMVYDGGEVQVPIEMGQPGPHQMQGTIAENLSELSMRVCYDSLALDERGKPKCDKEGKILKSRGSTEAHEHIHQVKHYNVYEHPQITIEIDGAHWGFESSVISRPGVWVEYPRPEIKRVTLNPRCLIDWELWTKKKGLRDDAALNANWVGQSLYRIAALSGTLILPVKNLPPWKADPWRNAEIAVPSSEEEIWISLFLSGSRGFSHEQVRHRFRCAVSQRSSRYCEESESPWVIHPLISAFLEETNDANRVHFLETANDLVHDARALYVWLVEQLIPFARARVPTLGALDARKQARGAARGFLGNALMTEMIFSASIGQWFHMMDLRAANAADAEIRVITTAALPVLKTSRHGDRFAHLDLGHANDGVGTTVRGGGHT